MTGNVSVGHEGSPDVAAEGNAGRRVTMEAELRALRAENAELRSKLAAATGHVIAASCEQGQQALRATFDAGREIQRTTTQAAVTATELVDDFLLGTIGAGTRRITRVVRRVPD